MRQTHASCQRFFDRAIGTTKVRPAEVMADKAAVYPRVLDERVPAARHRTDRYGNNRIEADHGQLKRRLRPIRTEDRRRRQSNYGRTCLRPEPTRRGSDRTRRGRNRVAPAYGDTAVRRRNLSAVGRSSFP